MEKLPLSALLSQALIAFTIELDNEFETRVPHWTAATGRDSVEGPAVWLASYEMWANLLRFVDDDGISVHELLTRPGAQRHAIAGMYRWRYIIVRPDPLDRRKQPPRRDWIVKLRPQGRTAAAVWRELPGEIERRWRTRFGERTVDRLGASLQAIVEHLGGLDLPHYLPGGSFQGRVGWIDLDRADPGSGPGPPTGQGPPAAVADALDLPALLSQPLHVFTVEYERSSEASLAFAANLLRILDEHKPVRVRDLPRLSGCAKEAINQRTRRLEKAGLVVIEPDPNSAARKPRKQVRLTATGAHAKAAYPMRAAAVEREWRARYGERAILDLRNALEEVVLATGFRSGLEPPANGWRVAVARPDTLPHYPLVTHRGGYPDGS